MKKLLITILSLNMLSVALPAVNVAYGEESVNAETEPPKGPHGGRLLEKNGFAIEVTIFETGVPPEMRLYAYKDNKPLSPSSITLTGKLGRLGGVTDNLSFTPEKDYLVSDQEIVEPHSFDVSLSAQYSNKNYNWSYDSYEGRAEITDRMLKLAEIDSEAFAPVDMVFTEELFGVVKLPPKNVYAVHAPYKAVVVRRHVGEGDKVKKGQTLATLKNTQTLQSFTVTSPANGMVTGSFTNTGDVADSDALFEISDFTNLWVELSAFPDQAELIKLGQAVTISSMHGDKSVQGTIDYLSPAMNEGHIVRARVNIDNDGGQWRPDMHVKAAVTTRIKEQVMAVRLDALQTFRDMDVVFARFGNMFEVRMLELGERNSDYVEVLGGMAAGTHYVSSNSFVLKADVLKDGASHDH